MASRQPAQPAAAQTANDTQAGLAVIEATTPHPATDAPRFGNFYTFQHLDKPPPLPFDAMGLPFWDLGDGIYLVDDRNVDYAALQAEADAEAEAEASLRPNSRFSMMASSLLNTSFAYGNAVYLTNMAATLGGAATTASFSIAGGTNFVPYDILTSTNAGLGISNWTWLGIGYTSNFYTFTNQPSDQAYYALARPHKTMVVGWGTNDAGQCNVPSGLTNALMVAGGVGQSLALLTNGTVMAWGQNTYGQGSVPTNLPGATMIAAGWYHDVALLTNGTVIAWGANSNGVYSGMTNVPPGLTNVTVIAAQAWHTLALRSNGTVVAWGYNSSFGETNAPAGLSNVTAIAAGYQFNVVALSNGTVTAWGENVYGQTNVPAGLSNVVDVAAGPYHALALLKNGTVVAWGDGIDGETNVPAGLTNVVAIAAGGDPGDDTGYSLALKSDGTVVAWGNGPVVAPVQGLSNVFAIGGGEYHALAVRTGPPTPVITLEPTEQFALPGSNATFTARGAGLYGVTYQWQTNGVNLTGATNATLTLTNVQAAQQMSYDVVIHDNGGLGSLTSSNAAFTLVTPPVILSQSSPTNFVGIYGSNVTLSVTYSAPGQAYFPVVYPWKFNGTNAAGRVSISTSTISFSFPVSSPGTYSVTVSNAAGSSATAYWQVSSITYVGSYLDAGTLAYHLSTNAVGYASGYSGSIADETELANWTYGLYSGTNLALLTNAVWSTNFWLHGVKGLSATAIGYSNGIAGQSLVTMVSPRHYLFASHQHPEGQLAAFLDTNNVIYWRTTLQRVDIPASFTYGITNDISVGILNADLPASVGYLPVAPTNLLNYLPTNNISTVQGIGMNQDLRVFSQPMTFGDPVFIDWSSFNTIPFGLGTNWNVTIRGGDSSNPERLLINNQLVLATHNFQVPKGPNYALQIDTINQYMHYLSTNNGVGTDYQLTQFPVTNWTVINH